MGAAVNAKDAAELLPKLSNAEVPKEFMSQLQIGRETATRWLSARDEELFNQTVIASLIGVSKSTISRGLPSSKPVKK